MNQLTIMNLPAPLPPALPAPQAPQLEIVYVLTNPAMPGLVKIGFTTQDEAKKRIDGLYTTGVPFPFKIEFVCKVPNAAQVEAALHTAFGPQRVNLKREFFQIDPTQAIAILKLLHEEETTEEVNQQPQEGEVDAQSVAAAEQFSRRRPNLNFEEMGIPMGSELICTSNDAKVTVVENKKVKLGDEVLSLSAATKQVLQLDYPVPPAVYWAFNGRLLREIYNETYSSVE
jgi:hypothetical protein